MEDEKKRFQEQLKELLQFAKQKKNVLESQEIVDFFKDIELDKDKLEKIYEFLEKQGIDILRFQEESEDDKLILESDDMELENEDELENYMEICDFGPPIVPKNN